MGNNGGLTNLGFESDDLESSSVTWVENQGEPTGVVVISKVPSEANNNVGNGKVEVLSTTAVAATEAPSQDTGRDEWDKPIEFLLSCISMSVGLGNIWRFPFTCYENGGGCFLIVYLVVLILIGRPIYFLELYIGQFSSSGTIRVWKMVPILKGMNPACLPATKI